MHIAVTSTDTYTGQGFANDIAREIMDSTDPLVLFTLDDTPVAPIARQYAIEHRIECRSIQPQQPDEPFSELVNRMVTTGAWRLMIFATITDNESSYYYLEHLMSEVMDNDLTITVVHTNIPVDSPILA